MMHPRRNPSHRVQHQPRSHTQSWPHRSFATNASTGGPSRRGITNFFLLRECRIFCTRYLRTSRRCFIVVLSITMLVCLRGASFFFVSNYSHMEFDLHSKSVLRDVSTLSASVTTRNHPQLFERFKQESKQAAKPPPAFTASNAPQDQMAAVVAMLRGELGNHLSGIAHARGLQLWMLEHHGISSKLVLHHPDHRNAKYKITREAVQQCFVNLRRFEHFDDGQYQDVDALDGRGGNGWWRWWTSGRNLGDYPFPESQTLVGMGRSDVAELDLVNGRPIPGKRAAGAREAPTKDDLSHALERFISLRQTPDPLLQPNHQLPVPLPYLQSESLDHFVFLDQYYTEMKELFKFDTESSTCCRQVPSPDETVFHFRNFASEMPIAHRTLGFEEISPAKSATALFGHLEAGDRVAIVTRSQKEESGNSNGNHGTRSPVQAYVHALEARGLVVRIVEDQTPLQDFCFLLNARREIIGSVRSTFVVWACVLGSAAKTRLYMWDTIGLRRRFGGRLALSGNPESQNTGDMQPPTEHIGADNQHPHDLARHASDIFLERFAFNWTQPELRSRIHFEAHKSEELWWMEQSKVRRGSGARVPRPVVADKRAQ